MEYSIYQLLWFFVLYSFIGWILSTSAAAIREKKFIDVGLLYGPYCPAYGAGALSFAIFLPGLHSHLFFLFLGGLILSSLVALLTGGVLERIFHKKWWDFSMKRFQFNSHVNLSYALFWGLSAILCIRFLNPLFSGIFSHIPVRIGKIVLFILYGIFVLDFIGTTSGIIAIHSRIRRFSIVEDVSQNLQKATDIMGKGLASWVQRHLEKAYPSLNTKELLAARLEKEKKLEEEKEKAGIFAVGCSFYKLACLFFLASFLGDITETIFCYLKYGILMSRSSVVYGPFSIVWGLGCVLLTMVLYQYRNHSDRFIFLFGTVIGGAYEYICSVFTEIVFGTVFWDYSHMPFNLGGRINLLYCFFWGIVAVLWLKILYPFLSDLIEKIPKKLGIFITWIFVIFMSLNIILSALALGRYTQRHSPKSNASMPFSSFIDEHFPDERIERIYPNAIMVED